MTMTSKLRDRIAALKVDEKQMARVSGASAHLHALADAHRVGNVGGLKRDQAFWSALIEDMEHVEWMLTLWAAELAEEGVKCTCEHEGLSQDFRPMLYSDRDAWEVGNNARAIITKAQRVRQKVRGIMHKAGWA